MTLIEIAEQCETTHSDGDALLGQVLGINPVVALGFNGDVARGRWVCKQGPFFGEDRGTSNFAAPDSAQPQVLRSDIKEYTTYRWTSDHLFHL
jgi:hypothetical protein